MFASAVAFALYLSQTTAVKQHLTAANMPHFSSNCQHKQLCRAVKCFFNKTMTVSKARTPKMGITWLSLMPPADMGLLLEVRRQTVLPTAADIYQFGGLCYYMTIGLHPCPLADAPPLPNYVPEERRLMVSLGQAANPADRPTLAQLQLHLYSLCQWAPKAMQVPAKSAPAVSTRVPSHGQSQGLFDFALSQTGLHASEAAASGSSAVLPRMAANPLLLPSSGPAQTCSPDCKVPSRATYSPARTQRFQQLLSKDWGSLSQL